MGKEGLRSIWKYKKIFEPEELKPNQREARLRQIAQKECSERMTFIL